MTNSLLKKLFVFLLPALSLTACGGDQTKNNSDSSAVTTTTNNGNSQNTTAADTSKKAVTPPTDSVSVQSVDPADTFPIDTTKKYVFLTFDDGPQGGTMNVYNNVKALGLKATFFMVGLHATYGRVMHNTVDTIRNSYPQILLANHSYTHANDKYIEFYHNVRSCFEDFMRAQQSLGVQKKIIRLPGNSAWVLSTGMLAHPLVKPVCDLLDSAGYSVIGWDVEWSFKRDPSGHGSVPVQTPETMVKMVEYALNKHHTHRRNAVVILSHDRMFNHPNYSDSLYKFMQLLKTRNPDYVFETIDHYPGIKRD